VKKKTGVILRRGRGESAGSWKDALIEVEHVPGNTEWCPFPSFISRCEDGNVP